MSRVTVATAVAIRSAVLTQEKRARIFARLTLAEERLIVDRTKLFFALALALSALTLLPAAAAQAEATYEPASFTNATFTPTCTSGTGEYPCVPGQDYQSSVRIAVQESCRGDLASLPGGIAPSGLRDPGVYGGYVAGREDTNGSGAIVYLVDRTENANYVLNADLSPNKPGFTGTWEVVQIPGEAPIDGTGKYSVTGQRTVGPIPGCSGPVKKKKCKKKPGKKSEAQFAKKKKCKK